MSLACLRPPSSNNGHGPWASSKACDLSFIIFCLEFSTFHYELDMTYVPVYCNYESSTCLLDEKY